MQDGPVRELYETLGAVVFTFSRRNRWDLTFIYKIRNILLKNKIDIVFAHHFAPLSWSYFATRFTKIKLTHAEHSRWQLEQLQFPYKMLNRIFISRSEAIVAISKQIEDYYVNTMAVNKNKVHFITNGIDLDRFARVNFSGLRDELGIRHEEKVIGMVANIKPLKNHKLLISAFTRVLEEFNDVWLVLVGSDFSGGKVERFATKTEAAERILFLGQRHDVPQLLRIFDIFCLTSVYEGMPLTALEAMAAGVPVIGSDVLGINEIITDNVNGLLFPSNDRQKLAEAILKLLGDEDLRLRLSRAGKFFVKENHCLDYQIKEYENLFERLCEQ
jgi:glycosyltransferase involved in cell wall biosynthesis